MKNFGQIQKVLLGSVSALVLTAVATPVFAQSSDTIETVVVTARRAAIESAQKIKENSDQIVDAVAIAAEGMNVSPAEIALAWVLNKPYITAPIVGASKMEHLEQSLARFAA